MGLTVKDIKKSILPPVNNRLVNKTAGDGSFDFGSNFGNRTIDITFQDKISLTKNELYNKTLLVAAWLYPLDKLAKKLEIQDGTNYMGENGLYYMAKVDGETDLDEILEYGTFTVSFICSDPFHYGLEETFNNNLIIDRNSTGYDGSWALIAANLPRYFPATMNIINNSAFLLPAAGIPQGYQNTASSATGSHSTTAGVYQSTMLTSTGLNGHFGINCLNLAVKSTDVISASVYSRVVFGTANVVMKLYFLDAAGATLGNFQVQSTSTTFTRIQILNKSFVNQAFVFLLIESIATVIGYTGQVEFYSPQIERNAVLTNYVDSSTKGLMIEEGTINLIGSDNFETGVNGWQQSNCTLSSSTTFAYVLTHSLKAILSGAAGWLVYKNFVIAPLITDYFTLSYMFYGVAASVGKTIRIGIQFEGGANANSNVYTAFTIVSGWQNLITTRVTDFADRTSIDCMVQFVGFIQNDIIYIDIPQLEKKSYATTFTDGTRLTENITMPLNISDIINKPYVVAATIYPTWNSSSGAGTTVKSIIDLSDATPNNRLIIRWNINSFQLISIIGGIALSISTIGVSFNVGDQIKLYITRNNLQSQISIKINANVTVSSALLADTRIDPIYNIIKFGTTSSSNSDLVMKDFILTDSTSAPTFTQYGM
jgi:predicted phage tail component-like protein